MTEYFSKDEVYKKVDEEETLDKVIIDGEEQES